MWSAIVDILAYGMMLGWMTHGCLASIYRLDDTKSFWEQNGRKHSWFNSNRKFVPTDHHYRQNVQSFRHGKKITVLGLSAHWIGFLIQV